MTRITTMTANRRMLDDIARNHSALVRAQERLTSQRQISRPSDDPVGSLNGLDYRASLRRSEQFARNATDAGSWLTAGDTALSTSVDELIRAKALVIQARSGAGDTESRAALAAEIVSIRSNILAVANSTHLGRPIFAGNAASPEAFDSSGNYLGDQGSVERPIGPNTAMQVNRTGTEVFGSVDPDPIQSNVFDMLDAVATAVRTGDDAGMQASLGALEGAMNRIEASQVQIGARARQLEDVMARTEIADLDNRKALAEIEEVDIAESVIALNARQFSYQAALSSTAKIMQISLLDFLR